MPSRARAAIIGSITALLAFFGKSFVQDFTQNASETSPLLFAVVALVLLTLVISALDWIVSEPYARSARLRYLWDRLRRAPFLEGFWLDVGIDKSNPIGRVVNYSFISVIRNGSEFKISGRTWNTAHIHEYSWESETVSGEKNSLEFWYSATRPVVGGRVQTAKAKFKFVGLRLPDRYSGEYDEVFQTDAKRDTSINFFRFWSKGVPEEKQEKAARAYFEKFLKEKNFDPDTLVPRRNSDTDMRQAYLAFLRYSNQKEEEKSLVKDVFEDPANRKSAKSVLDLGPGEGLLTSCVLLTLPSPKPRYTGVDVSGAFLDQLDAELRSVKLDKTMLIKQGMEPFLSSETENRFDLILAFNSLYYVDDIDKVFAHMLRVLQPGGRLAALHTDIAQVGFLDALIGQVNTMIRRDVTRRIEKLGQSGPLVMLGTHDRSVTIEFPDLDDAQWGLVAEQGTQPGDPKVGDTAKLISFLLDMKSETIDEPVWRKAVGEVKRRVQSDKGRLRLPIKLQMLQKAA